MQVLRASLEITRDVLEGFHQFQPGVDPPLPHCLGLLPIDAESFGPIVASVATLPSLNRLEDLLHGQSSSALGPWLRLLVVLASGQLKALPCPVGEAAEGATFMRGMELAKSLTKRLRLRAIRLRLVDGRHGDCVVSRRLDSQRRAR